MGCNCGDNEYEIIVDNNGSCEPTTPEYYITLENVGVDGFSPTINQVNVTSSSFQLQITDVNGTETTGNIPLLSYLDNNFVTNTDLADTLTAYVTSTSLATTLANYVTNTNLATTLADYVTNSSLTTTLTDYVTNSSLNTTLNNYVTNSSLSSTLSAYALNADVVHKAGTETITGNKIFNAIYAYRIVGNPNNTSMSIDTYNGGQNLYIGAGEASFIQIGNTYNNPDIRLVGNTATFNGEDIATVDQIPTVGNGTITLTQGGVSKGTFTTNQSGNTTIDLDAGGGSNYTAGTGIDITNDTISIDTSVVAQLSDIPDTSDMATKTWVGSQGYLTSADLPTNYVTTDTAQTISGAKTFNNDIKLGYGKAIRNADNEVILLWGSGETQVGDNYSELIFKGNPNYPRPQYNSSYLALTSDIPTVNNPTITFTQGGTTKGTITLNQSSDQTIALDAGGSGGGSYTAGNGINITNDTISIDTSVVATQTDIANMVTTNTAQDISSVKTFLGEKAIHFKQSTTTDKLGFTLYNTSNAELGAFEYRPNTINSGALLNINVPYSSSDYIGFRYWGTAVNIIAPKVSTAGNYYIPTHITNGNTTVTANSNGIINISSLISGGGAVIDDNTPSTTTVYSSRKTQDLIDALVARIEELETNINGGNA